MATRERLRSLKEVFHSTDEEEGSWTTLTPLGTPDRISMSYDNGDGDLGDLPSSTFNSQESWDAMLSLLETKCEIDPAQLQLRYKLRNENVNGPYAEIWRAQLWHIDVVVKKIDLPERLAENGDALSPILAREVALMK